MPTVTRLSTISLVVCSISLFNFAAPDLASAFDKVAPAQLPVPILSQSIPSSNDATVSLSPDLAIDDAPVALHPAYTSLAHAVAAHATPQSVEGDLACMAGAIYFESKGEPLAGQLAVGQVIINRTRSGRFPKSICSVVTQRGQFSFVRAGRVPQINASVPAYRKAVAVAQVALDQSWAAPVSDALYFHASRVSPNWNRTRVAAIGRHVFYR